MTKRVQQHRCDHWKSGSTSIPLASTAEVSQHLSSQSSEWVCLHCLEPNNGPADTVHLSTPSSHPWLLHVPTGKVWCTGCSMDLRGTPCDEETQSRLETIRMLIDRQQLAVSAGSSISPLPALESFLKHYPWFAGVVGIMSWTLDRPVRGSLASRLMDFWLNAVLRSVGQVLFANNSLAGLVLYIAACSGQPAHFWWCGLLGVVTANWSALAFGMDAGAVRNGLFGFNACLLGLGCAFLFEMQSAAQQTCVAFAIIVGSMMTVVLFQALGNSLGTVHKVAGLSLPFNVVMAGLMLAASDVSSTRMKLESPVGAPHLLVMGGSVDDAEYLALLGFGPLYDVLMSGVAQLFFNTGAISGTFMVLALAIYSPISAAFAVLGSALGSLVGWYLGAPPAALLSGLWGYNSVLAGIAMGGMYNVVNSTTIFVCALSCIAAAMLRGAFAAVVMTIGIPPLSFPFVITGYFFLLARIGPQVELADVTTPWTHVLKHRAATVSDSNSSSAVRV